MTIASMPLPPPAAGGFPFPQSVAVAPRVSDHLSAALARRRPRGYFLPVAVLFLLVFTFVSGARAQSVRWESSDSGDPAELQLVFQDCAPEGDPQLPRIDGVTLSLVGTSTQAMLNNFTNLSRSTILTYRARAQRSGTLQIPAFTVQTNKGTVRVPAFSGGSTRSATEANVSSRLEPGSRTLWAGEVFPLTYVLDVSRRSFNQLGTNIEWNPAPLVVEDWSKFEPSEALVSGEPRLNITSKTRAYAKTPGAVMLNAANQLVNLQSGSIGFGLFQTPRIEQLSVTSDRPALVVRALPTPAPAGFAGAVGQFKLTAKVVPTTAAIGEPVTWTVELSGTGNWPEIGGLPQREVSRDFSVVQPQAKRTPVDGKLFDATLTEDVVLVPTQPGEYAVGPLNFVYFDPATGSYKTLSTPRTALSIRPAAPASNTSATAASAPGAGASGSATTAAPARPATPPTIPAPPTGIPRDPLPGSGLSPVPFDERTVVLLVLLPLCLLPFYWAWLAVRRARVTDPVRPRREAKQRLATTIAQIRSAQADHGSRAAAPGATTSPAGSALLEQLLLQWQHEVARLWGLAHAAPSPATFAAPTSPSPAKSGGDAAARDTWRRLWAEADRTLYGSATALPADWPDRAAAALAVYDVPGFRPWTALRPRNVLPFVAVVALALMSTTVGRADDAATAYRRGDFAAAAGAWTAAVARNPTDPIARHNLSLALAQQDRWGEAAAHAAAAMVQDPRQRSLRAQLALACEKAQYVPPPLAGFLPPGPLQSVAGNAAPGTWQFVLIGASVLFSFALGALLRGAYVGASFWMRRGALLALLVAALLGLSATASLVAYGTVADRQSVIAWRAGTLRSIPTEADTTQKTTALPAGSVGVQDKTFLGWLRLRFDNGQTGWVRQDDVIPVWR